MPAYSKGPSNLLKGPKQNAAIRPKKKKPASVKNQIRAIERLLRKEGLDARIHKKEEVRLAELQETAESHRVQELERKYAVRYHKIRFFERVKIERRIKQLKRELQSAEPNTDACSGLQTKLAQATGDLQYVVSFPKGEKYVSLLRNAEDPEAQKVLEAERKRIRAKVQQQLADIAMISQADEGLPQASHQPAQKSTSEPLQQASPVPAGKEARRQRLSEAASGAPSSKGKATQPVQHGRPASTSSQALAARARLEHADRPAHLPESGRHEAGAPGVSEDEQAGAQGAALAQPDDIKEDDFFMGSSGDEDDAQKQRPESVSVPNFTDALRHGSIAAKDLSASRKALRPAPQKQSSRNARPAKGSPPPGRTRKAPSHKQPTKAAAGPAHKPTKRPFTERGAGRFGAKSRPGVAAAGRPSIGQRPEKAPVKRKEAPAAAPAKPPGQPLRTRAEGGRKRRKK